MTADIFWIGPNSNVICTFSFIFHKLCKSDIFLYITHKKRIHEKKIFQAKVNQTYVISNDNKTIDWTWKKFRLKQLRGLQRSCYFFSYVSSIRCFFSFTSVMAEKLGGMSAWDNALKVSKRKNTQVFMLIHSFNSTVYPAYHSVIGICLFTFLRASVWTVWH